MTRVHQRFLNRTILQLVFRLLKPVGASLVLPKSAKLLADLNPLLGPNISLNIILNINSIISSTPFEN